MRSSVLAVLLLLPAPSFAKGRAKKTAQALPAAADVLAQALAPSAPAYEGRVSVDGKLMRVRFEPPDRYRREILGPDGRAVQVVVSDGKTEWIYDKARRAAWQGTPSDPASKRLALGEHSLLQNNYEVTVATADRVARRSVWMLSIRSRVDGVLSRRLWVDQKTGLALKSESYRADGTVASEMEFETAVFPRKPQKDKFFEFSLPRGAQVVKRAPAESRSLAQAKPASGMDPHTPSWLPPGYVFTDLDVMPRHGKSILHYRYSDGINVLSLFQCPPRVKLGLGNAKGTDVAVGKGTGTLTQTREGSVLGWSLGRSQYILVGAVPAESLQKVASSVR